MQIRLVPNTGVQTIELPPFGVEEFERFSEMVDLRSSAPGRLPTPVPIVRTEEDDWVDLDDDGSESSRVTATCEPLLELAEQIPGGFWIPIPFDRGGVWAALHVRPQSGNDSRRLVIAIDTTLSEDGSPDHGPEVGEVGECRPRPSFKRFWRQPLVKTWIERILGSPRVRTAMEEKRISRMDDRTIVGAIYAVTRLLNAHDIRIDFSSRPESADAVNVDVVLDLGNSRTCVLLNETVGEPRSQRLEISYPDEPHQLHPCPFDTHVAFADHRIVPHVDDDSSPFAFLSQVRLGPSASARLRRTTLDTRPLGLSSPKRYLWDSREPLAWDWRIADATDPGQDPPMIRGDVLRHMDPTRPLSPPPIPELPIRTNYPRLATAVWVVIEILEQAFRQVNSPGWRRADSQAPLHERRREIGNLVIMHPAGMHSVEIEAYRNACRRACELWASFRSDPVRFRTGEPFQRDPIHGVRCPQVQVVADEASSIQVCWLYGELIHNHSGDLGSFFRYLGRRRPAIRSASSPASDSAPVGTAEMVDTLRIASMDIGGGTIDLAIADYGRDSTVGTSISIVSRRLFHDGISRAGDDVVRCLLEEVVLPSIRTQAGIDPDGLDRLLSQTVGEAERRLRTRLVRNVWQPIALELLDRMTSLSGDRDGADVSRDIELSLAEVTGIDDRTLREFAEAVGLSGGAERIRQVKIRLDREFMARVVRRAIGTTVMQCADIVDQYACDLLIVGGRPSSIPAVRDLIRNSMAVPPGQIIFLADAKVGEWYPFRGPGGRIDDAKTCGVVGGSIVFRARYGLDGFLLRSEATSEPPAMFGYLQREVASDRVEFDNDSVLQFGPESLVELDVIPQAGEGAGLVIATRRIRHPNAEAKPIYQVQLKSRFRRQLSQRPVHQTPVRVRLRLLAARVQERLEVGRSIEMPGGMIDDVLEAEFKGEVQTGEGRAPVDASQAMQLVFRSAFDHDGYWIDSGRLRAEGAGR